MLITSRDNSRIKHLRKLLDKKTSLNEGLFVIEGENLISEAIKSNLLTELYVLDGENFEYDFEYDNVTLDVMKSISSLSSTPRLIGISKFINKNKLGNRIVLLDGVQDPGNVGTIIRSSKAFGIDTLVLGNGCCDLYNEKVIRSTQGNGFHMNIISGDLIEIIKELKNKEVPILGTRVEYGEDIRNLTSRDKECFCLVMGNEGRGVSKEVFELCDKFIYIEMDNQVESLNVGVATSILLYELNRK